MKNSLANRVVFPISTYQYLAAPSGCNPSPLSWWHQAALPHLHLLGGTKWLFAISTFLVAPSGSSASPLTCWHQALLAGTKCPFGGDGVEPFISSLRRNVHAVRVWPDTSALVLPYGRIRNYSTMWNDSRFLREGDSRRTCHSPTCCYRQVVSNNLPLAVACAFLVILDSPFAPSMQLALAVQAPFTQAGPPAEALYIGICFTHLSAPNTTSCPHTPPLPTHLFAFCSVLSLIA